MYLLKPYYEKSSAEVNSLSSALSAVSDAKESFSSGKERQGKEPDVSILHKLVK